MRVSGRVAGESVNNTVCLKVNIPLTRNRKVSFKTTLLMYLLIYSAKLSIVVFEPFLNLL